MLSLCAENLHSEATVTFTYAMHPDCVRNNFLGKEKALRNSDMLITRIGTVISIRGYVL